MTRAQRITIVVGLLILAWMLHVNLCDWVNKLNLDLVPPRARLLVYEFPRTVRGTVVSGLVADSDVDTSVAVIFGMALPTALVLTDVWFVLGWRRQSRRARGLCIHCGYDLTGTPGDKCPECGKPVTPRSVEQVT